MSLFRPATTVTSPSGEYWELYVSKTALPAWKGTNTGDFDVAGSFPAQLGLLELPLALVAFVWASLLVPLARVVVLLPLAALRGHRSHAVRIEAMQTFPQQQVLLWTTTDVHAARVLDEVAEGLSNGKIVQPEGAVYSGAE